MLKFSSKREFCTNTVIKKLENMEEFLVRRKENVQSRIEKDKNYIDATDKLINYLKEHKKQCAINEKAFNEYEIIGLISKRLNFAPSTRSSLILSVQNSVFRSFEDEKLVRILIELKEKVENRILLDKEPEKFNRNYGDGYYFCFDRWREIKALGLYKDLNQTKEEIQKNIEILQGLKEENADVSMRKRMSVEKFIITLEKDQKYFLSTKTIRKMATHPYFHKKTM